MLNFGRSRVVDGTTQPSKMSRNATSHNLPRLFRNENIQPIRKLRPVSRDDNTAKNKRKNVLSPSHMMQGLGTKRSAFADVTNGMQRLQIPRKVLSINDRLKSKTSAAKRQPPTIKEEVSTEEVNATLYLSALEELDGKAQSQPEYETTLVKVPERASSAPPVSVRNKIQARVPHIPTPHTPPPGVNDFDKETASDTSSISVYAAYIFSYLKSREDKYSVKPNFLDQHTEITNDIRSIVVDWMVEVQETLELNHETLYLAVKNMDLYLSNPKYPNMKDPAASRPIKRTRLRLIACASMLLAAQYDERLPPPTSDWLQMCDNDFTAAELNSMQQQLFYALDFNLGAPLSYRFLRRYCRACSIDIDLLTLARYILEAALMDSQFSSESDSLMASAALWLAMCMVKAPSDKAVRRDLWNEGLQHYTGYKVTNFEGLAARLNAWIRSLPKVHLKTVYSKYSHKVFRKVALIPPLADL
ncbi:G2/mitotic-specific cyclin-B3 [Cloeon dipterum]|uniref:G2/mitotic-specific cyclin-B3 n=1 Tax=Cloeon dipterum TaxID=197152 RepID=UPI00321FA99A